MADLDLDALADLVADRVVARLDGRQQLVDADTLAAIAGVSRDWVYRHRHDLGCIPLGTGSKPRLRFDRDLALARIPELKGQPRPRARKPAGARRRPAPLLPVRGRGE